MLREGGDVQNVTVVVGLRPYTAKANILPEQTIGRGTAHRIPTLRCGRTRPHQGHQAGPQERLESRPTLGWAGSPQETIPHTRAGHVPFTRFPSSAFEGGTPLRGRRPDCVRSLCSARVPLSPASASKSCVAATASAIARSSGSWRSRSSTSRSSRSSCAPGFRSRCPAARDRRGDKSVPFESASLRPLRSLPSHSRCRRRTSLGEASCR
jgi:hypothetical protein